MSSPASVWLPREAMWFFVCAPPVLALLFDPHCANTADNMLRAWVTLTLFAILTGVAVHGLFELVAQRIGGGSIPLRVLAHAASTAALVTMITYALHGAVRWLYPEVGNDIPGMVWRGILVAYGYLAIARFIGHLQARAVAEQTRAHAERNAALEARLLALTAQLQPHFLFNSLNVCAGLVHTAPDAAETMLDELAALLRYAVENGEKRVVPLASELACARAYLAVQSGRFGTQLRHEIVLPSEGEPGPELPPMTLQPLVENAVQHGLDCEEGAFVRITCRRKGARYFIEVENSGSEQMPKASRSTGIGLRNVRERLRLVYGDAAALVSTPIAGGGYRAAISIATEGA